MSIAAIVACIWGVGTIIQTARALHAYGYKRAMLTLSSSQYNSTHGRFADLYVASERKVMGRELWESIQEAALWPVVAFVRSSRGAGVSWWSVLCWSGVRAARRDHRVKAELYAQYRALADLRDATEDPTVRAALDDSTQWAYQAYRSAPGTFTAEEHLSKGA